jgi:hypothetical protein
MTSSMQGYEVRQFLQINALFTLANKPYLYRID